MKKLLVTLAAVLVSVSAFAQGTVLLNNRVSTGDAKVTLPDGSGPGLQGGMAQLYLSSGGTLTALTPATPFRSSSAAASFFLTPTDVVVPGVPAGSPATFVLRAWVGGSSFETATQFRGESGQVTVSALGGVPPGGGAPITTPDLAGLTGFALAPIPEPSTIALGVLGAAALLIRRRK
jgi:hypothetical protein